MNVREHVEYHDCIGHCGRDDIPANVQACADCLERLPAKLQAGLRHPKPGEILAVIARARIWFDNCRAN